MKEPNNLSILLCHLQNIPICIARQYIIKAILLPLFTIVPNAPSYLAGLINVAGQSVPLIDLAYRLGVVREQPYGSNTPILICNHEQVKIGLIVDEILGFEDVKGNQIQAPEIAVRDQTLLLAAVTIDTTIALLIDIPKIVTAYLKNNEPQFTSQNTS